MDAICNSVLPFIRKHVKNVSATSRVQPTLHDDHFHPCLRDYPDIGMEGELGYLQIVLPSDKAWRTHNYYKLVERQRNNPPTPRHLMPAPWPESTEESEAKRPRVTVTPTKRHDCRRSIQSAGGLRWSSADLALAATLLETPNARFPTVTFANQEEKRRVFSLVYDVLRYKSILNQALNDLYFFVRYPHLKERCHLVWLLFFDLYKRDFALRDPLEPDVEAAFASQGLHEVDETLWQLRVKLAATVSRLRIKSGAHSLSKLLPRHLRLTRSALEENVVTGWINIFKTNLNDTSSSLQDLGIKPLPRDRDVLETSTFKTDHLLPRFLHIMPSLREDLVESTLVKDNHIIMQERTFCLGPAVVAQLIKDFSLSGKVAQTHVNSPITMAYFANLLVNNDKIEALLVFGAGYRKEACDQYLRDLGVKNTRVYAENFASLSAESKVLDNVIAVLATPPNTNSSVTDPVDLAVARGGDLQILQQLTDDDFASTPRGDHINKFLVDQRDTLRRAMSKPQIQFVVYETHSRFTCENEEMVTTLVTDLNNYAAEVHLEELRRAQGESQEKERGPGEPAAEMQAEVPVVKIEDELSLPIPPLQTVVIPPTDLFELADLPNLCPNYENCLDLAAEGTYIAFIKRKEITRLDPKYMIQMAEARGLFGRPDNTPKTKTTGQTARAKAALAALQARSEMMEEKNKAKVKVEMDRIAAPTRASLLRDIRPPSTVDCPRYTHHLAHDGTPSYLLRSYESRKTFLTPQEEEDLICRLYTSPKVNIYPPTLYEDLPPLKFWNSPASVIESYLQRKVFQKRLQLAYEFNQTKVPAAEEIHTIIQDTEDSAEGLAQALVQLSEDRNYYTRIANKQLHSYEHFRESEVMRETHSYQNNALWNTIFPEQAIRLSEDSAEENPLDEHNTVLYNIKKRYIDYQNFYRLQHLNINKTEKPLAFTIGKHKIKESPLSKHSALKTTVSFSNLHQIISTTDISPDVSGFMRSVSEQPLKHKSFEGRLPKLKQTSLDSTLKDINMNEISDLVSRLSVEQAEEPVTYFTRESTGSKLRDSVVLTRQRLSKCSSKEIKRESEHGKKDEDDSSSDDEENWGNLLNRDSLILAQTRLERTSKDKAAEAKMSCDICNNRHKSIHFLCSLHANLFGPDGFHGSQFSIAPEVNILTEHRDSLQIIRKKRFKREQQPSVSCQVPEQGNPSPLSGVASTKSEIVKKGAQNINKNLDESTKSKEVKVSPSKLNEYLMSSVKINQVVINNKKAIK